MKLRMLASLFTLLLVVGLVIGGLTMAWFGSKDSPSSAAVFFTGDVDFRISGEAAAPGGFRWEMDECREFERTFVNSGTEPIFLRARLEETMLEGQAAWGAPDNSGDTAFAAYHPGTGTAANPQHYPLVTGQSIAAGTVAVWEEGSNLHVQYEAAEEWAMTAARLAVADSGEIIPSGSGGSPVPERFPFKEDFEELKSSCSFIIPMEGTYPEGALQGRSNDWSEAATLSIAAQADLIGGEIVSGESYINWTGSSNNSPYWEFNEDDGYWYYCQRPLEPGEEVSLGLTGCPLEAGLYHVKLYVEAVQALPGALSEKWGY